MSTDAMYHKYAVALALQVAAKEPARPKAIMVAVEEPQPELPPEYLDPARVLH